MGTITTSTNLFPATLVAAVVDRVKGHSSLAALSAQTPIPFAGQDIFVFTMDGEASIVGEGENKPAGDAIVASKSIKPIKFIYQHRITDEFLNMSEERQLPYLEAFTDGFAKKIARGLDIAAIHGVNPADGAESSTVGNNCFDKAVTNSVTYAEATVDDNIDAAVALIQQADGDVNGIAFAPTAASALGKIKTSDTGSYLYPEFRFGNNPNAFGGMPTDINSTVSFKNSGDRVIVGDFKNAFRWGYADSIPMEVILYGDPDGQGDLKRKNQIVLRAEAYLGWAVLDASSFAIVKNAAG